MEGEMIIRSNYLYYLFGTGEETEQFRSMDECDLTQEVYNYLSAYLCGSWVRFS